ncbi:MAG: hypothetical protein CVV49_00625 [Spirochaetae bacterium HGW-Spirochaetae-5]|nr:MAG: hypothetical protein CVV49_00625 [Spirochaetae bacterium HGW-Spirochaetae-5]
MKWEEVIKNPDYQKLSSAEKLQWRKEYFDDIVKPQINAEDYDSTWNEFTSDADQMENIKSDFKNTLHVDVNKIMGYNDSGQKNWDEAIAKFGPVKERKGAGFVDAILKGRYGSATAALTKAYLPDTDAAKGVKQAEEEAWQPATRSEKIGHNVGAIAADLPLFAIGGVIGGPGGAFALPAGLKKMTEEKERLGGKITLENSVEAGINVLEELPKEWIKGELLGLAGKTSGVIADKLGGGVIAKTTGEIAALPVETAALVGAERVLNDTPITADTILETLGTIGILKLSGSFPGAVKTAFNTAVKERGIPAEKIAENLKSETVKTMQDPVTGKEAIERAIVLTEKQIEAERVSKIQNEIIDKQIRANYKDGKSPEQIIQINQIPKEYRTYILDQTETGGYKFKPDILKTIDDIVNLKDPFIAQKYENILPNPIRDMAIRDGQRLENQFKELNTELIDAKRNLKQWEAQKESLHEQYIKEEIDKLTGNYRRFENQGEIRDKMDQVIDHALSVLKPEEQFRVAAEPTTLMDHIDSKESGFHSLKKPHQDAVQKEIIAKIIQKTGFIPPHIIETAMKKADNKVNRDGKPFNDAVLSYESGIKSLQNNSEYQNHLKRISESKKSDNQIESEILSNLHKVEIWTHEAKKQHQVNLQKALGESSEFGELNRSNSEYFGKDHLNDLMEFAVKSPEELSAIFEKANFLEREFKQKGASIDLFLNKSRFIANKLGEKVFKNFVRPLRQAEHNFVVESQKYKDWIKDNRKKFTAKEREEIGAHLISQMEQGKTTLNEMGIKSKTFEELSPSQQGAITEIRKVLDVMFERINAARTESGLEPLSKVDDYFTFLRKFSLLEELGYDPLRISKEQFESSEISDFKTRGLAFQFGKERIQSTRALETDAYYVLDKYLTTAIRTTHMTPIIGKLRNALDINDKMALTNPHAHKYLHDTLDYVSGKKLTDVSSWINAVANKVNHNLGTFILTYNFRSIGVQPSAIVNTIGQLGPHAVSKGLNDFLSSDKRKFAMEKSKVLKARMHDVTIEEMTKGFTGKIGKIKSSAAEIGTLPLRYLDLKTAQISWLSGFRYGKEQLKLRDKEAVVFADDIVINTQGSASRIDLAPVQHTPLGKSLTLFNTFVINNMNFLTSDIMGITKTNNLIAEGIPKNQTGKYTADNQVTRITGKDQYNVYERNRLLSTSEGLEKLMTLTAAGFVCNSIYELMGVKSPLPAPLSAAYEGFTGQSWVDALQGKQPTKKEEQLAGALKESMREFLSLIPVMGGSFRYGGDSAFGAVGGLVGETFDTLAEKPSSKPLAYIVAKWAGVPGGQQIYKILKQLSRERKEDEKAARRALNPADYIRRDMQKRNPYYQQKQEMKKQLMGY